MEERYVIKKDKLRPRMPLLRRVESLEAKFPQHFYRLALFGKVFVRPAMLTLENPTGSTAKLSEWCYDRTSWVDSW